MFSFKTSAIVFLVLISFSSLAQIDYKGFPQWSWHKQDSTEYYLYTPSDLKPGKKYPVALFLHGCCGTSYKATLRNTVDPPVRMWHQFGENKQSEPTYIISPATSRGWSQHIDNLKKVIDDLIANHHADPQRIYITGFSMGGAGTIEFITRYPNYFAAALPMGMDFKTDLNTIKHIPIWTNRGETDWWARDLHKAVAEIRRLNGDAIDSAANYVTGVNPRFTSFKGYGHGVQWVAASTQDLTGWAYSKINDGNKYPNVFFKSPRFNSAVKGNEKIDIVVEANDPDGTIQHVQILQDGKLLKKITSLPYTVSTIAKDGAYFEAIATDDKGKTAKAVVSIGKGREGGESFTSKVEKKDANEVLVSNVKSYSGKQFPVSKVVKGEKPHGDRDDDEITFSDVSSFGGLTLIQTDANDTINAQPYYVEFDVDEDVTVFVAYEKLDRLFTSKIPDWLKAFKKEDAPQIVAQYFYYDVYSKDFPKGKVRLPDAMEKANGVNTNYFIMVKKTKRS